MLVPILALRMLDAITVIDPKQSPLKWRAFEFEAKGTSKQCGQKKSEEGGFASTAGRSFISYLPPR